MRNEKDGMVWYGEHWDLGGWDKAVIATRGHVRKSASCLQL